MSMQRINHHFEQYYQPLLLVLSFVAVLLIGWARFLTGPELAFSFFYLPPIITVTWLVGARAGILISFVSASSWLVADMLMLEQYTSIYIPLINELFRLAVFLFIVFIIARYKETLDAHKELAMVDPLTGVANRRAFFQLSRSETERSRRYSHPFSVMVIDIDNFKQINDRFGHDTGDRLLITVVETIKHHVRAMDIVARFGGDEFVVLLARAAEKPAIAVAGKLQKQLLSKMESNRWRVTFSIGLATYRSPPHNIEEAIKVADELMYQVKRSGKNDIKHAVMNMEEQSAANQ
jgi:diguanylate cyclase (GGDEF)-like protein